MKILIIFILLIQQVMADSFTFIVDNTTMVDVYSNIFNVVSSLFQSSIYLSLLKLAFLFGGFIAFFSGIIGKGGTASLVEFGKHLFIGTILLTLVFSHKSEVVIKTNSLGSFCNVANASVTTGDVVGNVPTLFAWMTTVTNTFGQEISSLAKAGFSPLTSNTTSMSRSEFAESLSAIGNIMSLNLDRITAESSQPNAKTIGSTLIAINNDCILIPASQDITYGQQIISTYKTSGDTMKTINDFILNGALVVYKNPTDLSAGTLIEPIVTINGIAPKNLLVDFGGETMTCGEALNTFNLRLESLKNNNELSCINNIKDILSPTAISLLTGNPGTESQSNNIIINIGVANQIADAKNSLASGTKISEMSYATGKSIAEVTLSSKASGSYLADMLPYIQMGLRAVIYAFFPFVFIIILLPGGMSVLKEYVKSIIWIELWTPAAAILDMFLNLSATDKFASVYNTGFNSLSISNVFSDATMLSGVAGYLYASIPAITWMIMSSTGESMESIGAGLMGGMSSGYNSIVEKNLNSETQNQDKILREMRDSTGTKISKIQAMTEEHFALKESGNWESNQNSKSAIKAAAAGSATADLISGVSDNLLYNQSNSQSNISAKIAENLIKQQSLTKSSSLLGIINKDGDISSDTVSNISNINSIKAATDIKTEMKTQELEKKVLGSNSNEDYINDKSNLNALSEAKKTQSEKTQQDTIGNINKGLSKEDANLKGGAIMGTDSALQVVAIGAELDLKGKVGKGTGLENQISNINAIATDVFAKEMGFALGSIAVGLDKITLATKSMGIEKIGIGKTTQKKLQKIMKISIQQGAPGAKAFENSIKHLSKDRKEEARASWLETNLGLRADADSKISGDSKALTLLNADINSNVMGEFSANNLFADMHVNQNYLNEIINGAKYKDSKGRIRINKNDIGYKAMKKAQKLDGVGSSNKNVNAAVLGLTIRSTIDNQADVYNKSKGFYETSQLKEEGYSSGRSGSADAFAKEVDVNKAEIVSNYLTSHDYAKLQVMQELAFFLGITMDALAELLSSMNFGRDKAVEALNEKKIAEQKKQARLKEEKAKNNKAFGTINKEIRKERRHAGKILDELKKLEADKIYSQNKHFSHLNATAAELEQFDKDIAAKKAEYKKSLVKTSSLGNQKILKNAANLDIDKQIKASKFQVSQFNKGIKDLTTTTTDKLKELMRPMSDMERAHKIETINKQAELARAIDEKKMAEKEKLKVEEDAKKLEESKTTHKEKYETHVQAKDDLVAKKSTLNKLELDAAKLEVKYGATSEVAINARATAESMKIEVAAAEATVKETQIASTRLLEAISHLKGKEKIAAIAAGVSLGTLTTAMAVDAVWDEKKSLTENTLRTAAVFDITGIATASLDVATDNKKYTVKEATGTILENAGKSQGHLVSHISSSVVGFVFGKDAGTKTSDLFTSGTDSIGHGLKSTAMIVNDLVTKGSISDKTYSEIDKISASNSKFDRSVGNIVDSYKDGSMKETIIRSTSNGIDHTIKAGEFIGDISKKGYEYVKSGEAAETVVGFFASPLPKEDHKNYKL